MSSAGASPAESPTLDPTVARDIERYVSTVDDLMLDVPWQRRKALITDLRGHLQENPGQIAVEPPEEYAAELRATSGAVPGGLLSGIRSMSWPTPVQWWESTVRGGAVIMIAGVIHQILAFAGQYFLGDPTALGPWPQGMDRAVRAVYPTPDFHGSTRDGVLVFVPLAILIGQLSTAAVLGRAPHRRPTLRLLTYVSVAVIVLLLGYGGLRSYSYA